MNQKNTYYGITLMLKYPNMISSVRCQNSSYTWVLGKIENGSRGPGGWKSSAGWVAMNIPAQVCSVGKIHQYVHLWFLWYDVLQLNVYENK